jgi:hypothetical protein
VGTISGDDPSVDIYVFVSHKDILATRHYFHEKVAVAVLKDPLFQVMMEDLLAILFPIMLHDT